MKNFLIKLPSASISPDIFLLPWKIPQMPETTASFSTQLWFTLRANPLCALRKAWVMWAKENSVISLKFELKEMHAKRLNPYKRTLVLALHFFQLQTWQSPLSKKRKKKKKNVSLASFILHTQPEAVWCSMPFTSPALISVIWGNRTANCSNRWSFSTWKDQEITYDGSPKEQMLT